VKFNSQLDNQRSFCFLSFNRIIVVNRWSAQSTPNADSELKPSIFASNRTVGALTICAIVMAVSGILMCLQVADCWADPNPTSLQMEPAPQREILSKRSPHRSRLAQIRRLSDELTEYLHSHRLPHVDALVFGGEGGKPRVVNLSGAVRTDHGKSDAQQKADDYLGNPAGLRVDNHIEVDPTLGAGESPLSSSRPESPWFGGPQTESDPCLCVTDEDHCKKTCMNQAVTSDASNSDSSSGGLGSFLSPYFRKAPKDKQCVDLRESPSALRSRL
jgi:hypothetical protein